MTFIFCYVNFTTMKNSDFLALPETTEIQEVSGNEVQTLGFKSSQVIPISRADFVGSLESS